MSRFIKNKRVTTWGGANCFHKLQDPILIRVFKVYIKDITFVIREYIW